MGNARSWHVVVPLKPTARAKTRLGLSAHQRARLARAFALDTVAAACAAAHNVTVVAGADDRAVFPPAVHWTPDPGDGLNAALVSAVAGFPADAITLVLVGDLPCARAEDVALLLMLADDVLSRGAPAAFLSDQTGVGTTALAAPRGLLEPRFGHHSRAAHRSGGAVEISDPRLPRLHRDVDSLVDLVDAMRLGVGPHTALAVGELGLPVAAPPPAH